MIQKLLKYSLMLCVAVGAFTLGTFAYKKYQHRNDLYYGSFLHAQHMVPNEGVILTGPCQDVRISFQLTTEAAILTVNNDKMTGRVVSMTQDNVLLVEFPGDKLIGFVRLTPNHTHDEEFLVILAADGQTILTNSDNCEEITRFLEQI